MSLTIFPDDITAGGVVIRDVDGNPVTAPGVENAYVPPASFEASCAITALPSDCDARVEPKQINAIVSELVALAQRFDPDGPWNCSSLTNLSDAFNTWFLAAIPGIYVAETPPLFPEPNKLWWESDTGMLFLWYNDGDTTQWVQINGASVFVDQVSIVGGGADFNPFRVGTIDCGAY